MSLFSLLFPILDPIVLGDYSSLKKNTYVAATVWIPSRSHLKAGWSDFPVWVLIQYNRESASHAANKWIPFSWYDKDVAGVLWGITAPMAGPLLKSMLEYMWADCEVYRGSPSFSFILHTRACFLVIRIQSLLSTPLVPQESLSSSWEEGAGVKRRGGERWGCSGGIMLCLFVDPSVIRYHNLLQPSNDPTIRT